MIAIRNKKGWSIAIGIALFVSAGVYAALKIAVRPMIKTTEWVYIHPYDSYDRLLAQMASPTVAGADVVWIDAACRLMGVDRQLSGGTLYGAYKLERGMTALQIARNMKLLRQSPVRLTFNNIRLKEDLAGRLAKSLMADSVAFLRALNDTALCRDFDTDTLNVESLFLPDTYEVYWTTTPEELMQRMKKEYDRFWTTDRRLKAEALGMTPKEVAVIASIAEEETQSPQERGVVARLYWNRLRLNMPLQADPTVKFALQDFSIRHIYKGHLEVRSPYNTYLYAGLPPGPIRIADKATIDAFLDSTPHNYIYMCAKEDFSGRHNFAHTLSEHNVNAAKYHKALIELEKKRQTEAANINHE